MEVTKLMNYRCKHPNAVIDIITRRFAKLWGCVVGKGAIIEENVEFVHNAVGSVIHSDTKIEKGVKIYQNVTTGRADLFTEGPVKIVLSRECVLCAGAKVICKANETLVVGEGAIVAANAVLNRSIPPYEIWGGPSKEDRRKK